MTMFDENWDYTEVRDFDKLGEIFQLLSNIDIEKDSQNHAFYLNNRLGLNIVELDAEQSSWYKSHKSKYNNIDIMLPERDYQRVLNESAKSLWR